MRSGVEKADIGQLHRLKDQKRRFIVLDPYQNVQAPAGESAKPILTLKDYDARIKARIHSSSLKGKHAFIFDLENEGHWYKLEQMLSSSSSYQIYIDRDTAEYEQN